MKSLINNKRKVNGRNKGKTGERELCKILSNHLSGNFMRSPHSGATVGGKNRQRLPILSVTQGRAFKGDIIPPDHLTRMYLEVKSYKDFRFHQLLYNQSCSILDDWIVQCEQGIQENDVWFICFKISQKGWYIVFDQTLMKHFQLQSYAVYTSKTCQVVATEMHSFLTHNSIALQALCAS
jgi:hypothetical protein